jgi:hypothetical protein
MFSENDHVGCRIVATKSESDSEQADDEGQEIPGQDQKHQKRHKNDHLNDEHRFASITVGHTAKTHGADEDAELAAPISPFCADPISNSREINGNATPVIKTT